MLDWLKQLSARRLLAQNGTDSVGESGVPVGGGASGTDDASSGTDALSGTEFVDTTPSGGRDFIDLVLDASWAAQSILLLLLALLFFTVWFILRKRRVLRRYEAACDAFERAFWGGSGIGALAARVRGGEFGDGGLAKIFLAGQGEFDKQRDAGAKNPELILPGVRRAMDAAMQRENQQLDRHMEFLSTTAGFSPYVGLLGTVWGIINAFSGLIDSSQATIAQVAPGIAEALVATAMGLIAAIPALIAFNHYSSRLSALDARFEIFADNYLNILARNL